MLNGGGQFFSPGRITRRQQMNAVLGVHVRHCLPELLDFADHDLPRTLHQQIGQLPLAVGAHRVQGPGNLRVQISAFVRLRRIGRGEGGLSAAVAYPP